MVHLCSTTTGLSISASQGDRRFWPPVWIGAGDQRVEVSVGVVS